MFCNLQFILIGFLLKFASCQTSEDQFMLCKSISSTFDNRSNQTNQSLNEIHSLRQGKRGPVGPPGPPGVIDYDLLSEVIRETIHDIRRSQACYDGVVVDKNCYRLIYRVGYRVKYQSARSLCNYHGGTMAEIPDEATYNAVFSYVQRSWSLDIANKDANYVDIWLGSDAFSNGQVTLSNGSAGFTHWYPDYPTDTVHHNKLALDIPIKPGLRSDKKGMFNIDSAYSCVPLCQYSLD